MKYHLKDNEERNAEKRITRRHIKFFASYPKCSQEGKKKGKSKEGIFYL